MAVLTTRVRFRSQLSAAFMATVEAKKNSFSELFAALCHNSSTL